MNVWSLDKVAPIKILLLELVHQYGENTFALHRHQPHPEAIELCLRNNHAGLAAYIYTFGQNRDCYAIDLKYPISVHNSIGENENLALEQVLDIIAIHFFS